MASVNKVTLIGNLGREPELRHSPSGAAMCNLAIATSRKWKDKNTGATNEETEWHRVVLYGKMADLAVEYLAKGKPVYIEGRLKTRKWTDKDGVEKYATEIVGENMQFLGSREEAAAPAPPPARAPAPAPRRHVPALDAGDFEDSIPF